MDNETPGLGVGFTIDPEGSFETLRQIQAAMQTTEAKVVAEAAKIERATGGMVNLSGATAQVTTFGNSASRELANVARDTSRAEKAGEQLVRQLNRQVETFGKTASEIRQMRAEMRAAEAESRGLTELAGRIRETSAALDRLEAANDNISISGRRQSGVVAALIPQINDLGVQFAMAAQSSEPLKLAMMAIIQQGSQIQQIGMQAGMGIGAMAKQMLLATGSFILANPVILGTVAAITAGTFAFKGFTDTLEQRAPVEDYIRTLGLTDEEAKKLTATHVTLGDAAGAAWDVIREALGLESVFSTLNGWVSDSALWMYGQFKDATASVYAFFRAAYENIGRLWSNLPALLGDAVSATVNEVMNAIQSLINDSIKKINWVGNKAKDLFGIDFSPIGDVDLGRYKAQYSAAGKEFAGSFAASFNAAYGDAMGVFGRIEDGAIANRNKRLSAQADEILKGRKTKAEKAAQDEVDLAKWAADQMQKAYGNVWKLAEEIRKRSQDDWTDGDFARARANELNLQGLTVSARILEQDRARSDLRRAEIEGERQLLDLSLQRLDAVQRLGGLAGNAAGVLAGILDGGNFLGGGGKAGALLDVVRTSMGDATWQKAAGRITEKLDTIFGGQGEFARIMSKTFAAGGAGSLAGSMAFGSKNSQLGSFAGGAIGEKIGEKFLSKALGGLGDFAGPLGSIVGGVLGGALGGLFSKAKWGTSVVNGQNSSDIATAGNKAAYRSNAGLAGDSIQSGLQAIADQLGADIGNYTVSIGQYKDAWRVSSTGRTGKLKDKYGDVTDFGKDGAEDAIKFAIADAISDGALLGLRASTSHILQAGKDVERQLAKALQFEGVFSDLKRMTDPVGFAIEQLDKEFAQLRKTFAEAGASAEEYAQLQQLYDLKRVEALKDANAEAEGLLRDRRTLEARIMELQGNTLGSIALMRQLELEQMEASLRPLQEQVWALEDAAEAADAAKQLREAWASIGDGIMEEVNRIRGLTDGSATGGFAGLMSQFNAATEAARGGDQAAAGKLAGLSQSLIDAAGLSATSRQELDRVKAQTAASLEQTYAIIKGMGGVAAVAKGSGSILEGGPAAALLNAAATNQVANAPASNDNGRAETKALQDEVAALRRDLMSALATVAGNTGKAARILDDVTTPNGGTAISVAGAA